MTKFVELVGCTTSSSRLDVGGDAGDGAHTGVFRRSCYQCGIRSFTNFADNSRRYQRILTNFEGWVGRLTHKQQHLHFWC